MVARRQLFGGAVMGGMLTALAPVVVSRAEAAGQRAAATSIYRSS